VALHLVEFAEGTKLEEVKELASAQG
jgi:hypothetical protein